MVRPFCCFTDAMVTTASKHRMEEVSSGSNNTITMNQPQQRTYAHRIVSIGTSVSVNKETSANFAITQQQAAPQDNCSDHYNSVCDALPRMEVAATQRCGCSQAVLFIAAPQALITGSQRFSFSCMNQQVDSPRVTANGTSGPSGPALQFSSGRCENMQPNGRSTVADAVVSPLRPAASASNIDENIPTSLKRTEVTTVQTFQGGGRQSPLHHGLGVQRCWPFMSPAKRAYVNDWLQTIDLRPCVSSGATEAIKFFQDVQAHWERVQREEHDRTEKEGEGDRQRQLCGRSIQVPPTLPPPAAVALEACKQPGGLHALIGFPGEEALPAWRALINPHNGLEGAPLWRDNFPLASGWSKKAEQCPLTPPPFALSASATHTLVSSSGTDREVSKHDQT